MKKRILCALLALCLAAALLPGAALAAGLDYNASHITVENGEATLARFPDVNYAGEAAVPETIAGHPVTAIGSRAFDSCTQLTGVVLPDGVRTIGAQAFRACTGLRQVLLPASVTQIAGDAFDGCPKNLIVYGAFGSAAEQFALAHNFTFLPASMPFTDVPEGQWFYPYIYAAYAARLMNGMTDATFAPNAKMTRAMLATVLYRLAGEPDTAGLSNPFTDVPARQYFARAVQWCAANGVVKGMTATTFAPNANVTREQTVTMLSRFCAMFDLDVTGGAPLASFPDAGRVQAYAQTPFRWAVDAEIINGERAGGVDYLRPQGETTRAQIAKMLVCTVQYLSNEGVIL